MGEFQLAAVEAAPREVNWDNFKCRCSSISKIMSKSKDNPCLTETMAKRIEELEARATTKPLTDKMQAELAELYVRKENSKKVILSDTCIDYLMETYAWEKEAMKPLGKEFLDEVFAIQKGKQVEEESITLLSLVDKKFYVKNDERVYNDYLSGEPDIFIGDNIYNADEIVDIKSLWDYPIFLKSIHKALENGYNDQVGGYCDITGARKGSIARCLVSMSPEMREDWRRRLSFRGGYATDESPEFIEAWAELEHSMIFDKIPIHKRVFKVDVEPFSAERRQIVYDRVKVCREWLWKFDEQYQNLNL